LSQPYIAKREILLWVKKGRRGLGDVGWEGVMLQVKWCFLIEFQFRIEKMDKPDIGIVFPDFFSEEFGEIVAAEIIDQRLKIAFIRKAPQPWNSIEWAIPGLIAVFVLKSYFESFLKEAGKDHYNLLKNCLNKLLKLNKNAPVQIITSDLSPDKTDKTNTQSKAISIHIEIKDGRKIKLLFDSELEIDDWTNSLERILDLIQQHYSDYPNDSLTQKLKSLENDPRFEIFALIDKETKEWKFLDLRKITAEKRKEKEKRKK